ncbi:MAG: hypothetical protein K2W82_09390 [Candidatus Obscuribacterales bacterium]|nr:hypothetical protein [Candidatus Obscuribacterales bacterium]
MRIIATGFDPFNNLTYNPSQDTVERLPTSLEIDQKQIPVSSAVLPTCCDEAWQILNQLVTSHVDKPFLLLLTGFAEKQDKIFLERFALNVRHYRIPDNNGHQHNDEYLDDKITNEAYRTKLPLPALEKHLSENGFACGISNHAGTFICNELYFRSLHNWQENPHCLGVLFVHLPPADKYQESLTKKERIAKNPDSINTYADCLLEIGKFVYANTSSVL